MMMLRTTWGLGWTYGAQVAGERSGQAGLTGNLNHSSIQPLERERGEVYRRVCVCTHVYTFVCVSVCACMWYLYMCMCVHA